MKQSFHSHFDRDLTKAGSAVLGEAVRRGLLGQHEAMIHDQQWAQFCVYARDSHEVDILEFVNKKLVREYGDLPSGQICSALLIGTQPLPCRIEVAMIKRLVSRQLLLISDQRPT